MSSEYELKDKVRVISGLYQLLEGVIYKIDLKPRSKSGNTLWLLTRNNRILRVNETCVVKIK